MKNINKLLVRILIITLILSGCASSIETSKKLMGTSVEELENARASGKHEVFEYDYPACYGKVVSILKKMNAYLFLHSIEKHRIVAMNFKGCNNTTAVGIFFTEAGPKSTEITLSCLSPSVLESVSLRLFNALKGINLPMEPELPDSGKSKFKFK